MHLAPGLSWCRHLPAPPCMPKGQGSPRHIIRQPGPKVRDVLEIRAKDAPAVVFALELQRGGGCERGRPAVSCPFKPTTIKNRALPARSKHLVSSRGGGR